MKANSGFLEMKNMLASADNSEMIGKLAKKAPKIYAPTSP